MKLVIDISESYFKQLQTILKNSPEYPNLDYCQIIIASGTPYKEEISQGESIRLEEGLKKARRGKYVIYDVDFLLDNLAREVNIMESARKWEAKQNE